MAHAHDNVSVPKFGSFRPKTSQHSVASHDTKRDAVRRPDPDTHHREERESVNESSNPARAHRQPPPQETSGTSRIFWIDVRGDPQNAQFGSLHRGDIPLYYRVGSGSIVGAPACIKIDREASSERSIVLRDTRSHWTSSKPSPRTKAFDKPTRDFYGSAKNDVHSFAAETSIGLQQDFVALKSEPPEGLPLVQIGSGIWEFIEHGSQPEGEEATG